MPDNTTAEDPRSPTPDPVGIPDEEFEKMMRLLEKSLPTSEAATGVPAPASTSEPLSVESALDAQKKQNTGITSPSAALRNEAARRAIQQQQMPRGRDYSAMEDMHRRMRAMREEAKRDQKRGEAMSEIRQGTAPSRAEE